MSAELMTSASRALEISPEPKEFIRQTIFPGSTDAELELYLHDCKRQGIHPLDRLIVPTIRTNKGVRKYTPIVTVDLMRSRAEETGCYAGNDDPEFTGEPKKPDFTARTTVWKLVGGVRCAFTATARWAEYFPGGDSGFMWNSKPHLMLGKCSEALALRKAFPRQLSGLYVKEEMEQAGVIDVDPAPTRDAGPSAPLGASSGGGRTSSPPPPPDPVPAPSHPDEPGRADSRLGVSVQGREAESAVGAGEISEEPSEEEKDEIRLGEAVGLEAIERLGIDFTEKYGKEHRLTVLARSRYRRLKRSA